MIFDIFKKHKFPLGLIIDDAFFAPCSGKQANWQTSLPVCQFAYNTGLLTAKTAKQLKPLCGFSNNHKQLNPKGFVCLNQLR
jgi:hypothetical protein